MTETHDTYLVFRYSGDSPHPNPAGGSPEKELQMTTQTVKESWFAGEDPDHAKRDKRGRTLATMGHVARTDDGFEVTTAGRRREVLRVWRDEAGRVQCSCAEFQASTEPRFRCEHILAVKYYLEPPTDPNEPAGGVGVDAGDEADAETPAPGPVETGHELLAIGEGATAGYPLARGEFGGLLRKLSEPLPGSLIRQRVGWTDRSGREHDVDYVEWHVVADILDAVAVDWSHAVRNVVQIGPLVAVTASITIGGVTREGIGTGEATDEKGIKKAEHDALKRAAVKFGIARELYRDDGDGAPQGAGRPAGPIKPDQAVARTIADLVTPKQLVAIRAIANSQGLDAEKRSMELYNCRPEELSKRAASQFIDELKVSREDAGRRAS